MSANMTLSIPNPLAATVNPSEDSASRNIWFSNANRGEDEEAIIRGSNPNLPKGGRCQKKSFSCFVIK